MTSSKSTSGGGSARKRKSPSANNSNNTTPTSANTTSDTKKPRSGSKSSKLAAAAAKQNTTIFSFFSPLAKSGSSSTSTTPSPATNTNASTPSTGSLSFSYATPSSTASASYDALTPSTTPGTPMTPASAIADEVTRKLLFNNDDTAAATTSNNKNNNDVIVIDDDEDDSQDASPVSPKPTATLIINNKHAARPTKAKATTIAASNNIDSQPTDSQQQQLDSQGSVIELAATNGNNNNNSKQEEVIEIAHDGQEDAGNVARNSNNNNDYNDQYRPSYYLTNFFTVVNLIRKKDAHLFTEEDLAMIDRFSSLPEPEQRIYIRLYQRKGPWFQVQNLSYREIEDIPEVLKSLEKHGFVEFFNHKSHDFAPVLSLLTLPDLRIVAKNCGLRIPTTGAGRDEISRLICETSTKQRTLDGSKSPAVFKAISAILGPCVSLTQTSVGMFRRMHRLFFLNQTKDSTPILMANLQVVTYPNYKVEPTSVFPSREALLDYEEAVARAEEMAVAFHHKDLEAALPILEEAAHSFCSSDTMRKHQTRLAQLQEQGPDKKTKKKVSKAKVQANVKEEGEQQQGQVEEQGSQEVQQHLDISSTSSKDVEGSSLFLLRFTAGWVNASIVNVGIMLLEMAKNYEQAVLHLWCLLDSPFSPGRRGKWWNRLAINLEHLGKKREALEVCVSALNDPHVRTGERLSIEKRFQRLCKTLHVTSAKARLHDHSLLTDKIRTARDVYIRGRPLQMITGRKSTFIGYKGNNCSVEELALQFYEIKGDWKGIHCEGGVFRVLFSLLFWDILFCDSVPYVFQTPYQDAPLDLNTDAFYSSRKDMIEAQLEFIRNNTNNANVPKDGNTEASEAAGQARVEESGVSRFLARIFEEHYGQSCIGVDWNRISLPALQMIAACVGGPTLAAICRVLAEDYKHYASGMPDLLLWNAETRKAKFVEVKGPRDRLSDKQRIWIDLLLTEAAADVEVCHVSSVDDASDPDGDKVQYEDDDIWDKIDHRE